MADDLDDLGRRIDRIEHALRRSPDGPARTPAAPEIRSARSIVNRVDDVWVAVTEGNERVAAAIGGLRAELGRLTAALHAPDQSQDEGDPADPAEPDPAIHLRLNRVEEALAGIAARLEELATVARPAEDAAASTTRAAVEELGGEVRGLANRVDGLAQALEASAARSADATLAERLGRLRDQFRR